MQIHDRSAVSVAASRSVAAAMAACSEPDWGPSGYMVQGINNDPLVLRAMLRRLELSGWDDAAGAEKNQERWAKITAVELSQRNCLRGNGPDFGTNWSSKVSGATVTQWWSPSNAAFMKQHPRANNECYSWLLGASLGVL